MDFIKLPEMVLSILLTLAITDLIVNISLIIPPDPSVDRWLMVTCTISLLFFVPFAMLDHYLPKPAANEGMKFLLYACIPLAAIMLLKMHVLIQGSFYLQKNLRCLPNGKGYLPPGKYRLEQKGN